MSEKLLDRHMERLTNLAESSMDKAAVATAKLEQAGNLLTSLGVPMTTDPEGEGRTRGLLLHHFQGGAPRSLTLTERIMWLADQGGLIRRQPLIPDPDDLATDPE